MASYLPYVRVGTRSGSIFKTRFISTNLSLSPSSSHIHPNYTKYDHFHSLFNQITRNVRRLEAEGVPSQQAEAITSVIIEVLNDSLENVGHSIVSKDEMQRENHFSLLQREMEKLKSDIDKMRNELRYEIDKVTAGQRLDLNLERGRIRDELSNQIHETASLTNKLDREIHSLRAELEAAKYDVIKYCIATLVSISAVGLAILRILM